MSIHKVIGLDDNCIEKYDFLRVAQKAKGLDPLNTIYRLMMRLVYYISVFAFGVRLFLSHPRYFVTYKMLEI